MKAIAGPSPASFRSVAIDRPGCTAGRGSLTSGPSTATVCSRLSTPNASPQRRAGPSGSERTLDPSGASTTSRITSPIRKKACRVEPPGVSPSRRRRKSSPAARSASIVRSSAGLITTRWSTVSTPLGCCSPAAGGRSDPVVGRPSRSSEPRSRTDQPTIPRRSPGPASPMRTVPTSQPWPSTRKPAACQRSGGSATVSSSTVGCGAMAVDAIAPGPTRPTGSA